MNATKFVQSALLIASLGIAATAVYAQSGSRAMNDKMQAEPMKKEAMQDTMRKDGMKHEGMQDTMQQGAKKGEAMKNEMKMKKDEMTGKSMKDKKGM